MVLNKDLDFTAIQDLVICILQSQNKQEKDVYSRGVTRFRCASLLLSLYFSDVFVTSLISKEGVIKLLNPDSGSLPKSQVVSCSS